jgi:hypothetical protein
LAPAQDDDDKDDLSACQTSTKMSPLLLMLSLDAFVPEVKGGELSEN